MNIKTDAIKKINPNAEFAMYDNDLNTIGEPAIFHQRPDSQNPE